MRASPLFAAVLGLATALTIAFLLLPIAALLIEVPPRDLPALIASAPVVAALIVTVKTNLIANALFLVVGTPAAYLLARRRFRGRGVLVTLLELPVVLPPAVAGIALLTLFGAFGLLGPLLRDHGVVLPFTQWAVVLAVLFVAAPFYLRAAISAFAALDRDQLDAARDLGAGEATVFRRVALPLAADGLRAGWALAFARGMGEFGATLLFAGSVERVTQTLPLAVYAQLEVDLDAAVAVGVVLLALSGAVLLIAKARSSAVPAGGW